MRRLLQCSLAETRDDVGRDTLVLASPSLVWLPMDGSDWKRSKNLLETRLYHPFKHCVNSFCSLGGDR